MTARLPLDSRPRESLMEPAVFEDLERTLTQEGPEQAIDRLCQTLRDSKEYDKLFYALLLKKRHELGVSPVPTEAADALPSEVHAPYEEAIRQAAREIGRLYLEENQIPRAWIYFRMIGEPQPVVEALEHFQPGEDEDSQQVIEIAFHQGVLPEKGFDWILQRYGICSAITMVSGMEFPQPSVREYCIRALVRALYAQLQERLCEEVRGREGSLAGEHPSVRQLIAGRDWLFADDYYHVDISHLSSVVQMCVYLPPCEELDLARQLCEYGAHVSTRFQYRSDPPFEDPYRDYGFYLGVLAGDQVEEGLAHFRAKVEKADPETIGTYPAEMFVNLLLKANRPREALAVARQYLATASNPQPTCPTIAELCRRNNDYLTLAQVAREQGDPVHFMAGLLAVRGNGK